MFEADMVIRFVPKDSHAEELRENGKPSKVPMTICIVSEGFFHMVRQLSPLFEPEIQVQLCDIEEPYPQS
jgi:hypothetical protein